MQPTDHRDSSVQRDEREETSSRETVAISDVVLVNPAAGGRRAAEILPSLRKLAHERKWHVEFCVAASPEDLAAKARCAANQGHRRLFGLGGDGTFQVLLNALADDPNVVLGIIPAGGGNDLARALGLPTDPLRAASLLLEHGQVCRMDAVCVRTSDGGQRLYMGGGGVGLDAEASRYASGAYRNLRGRRRYLLSALRALCSFRSFTATISMGPHQPVHTHVTALLIAVLNTPSYGAGIHLAPEAKTSDGALDLVILEDRSIFKTLCLLPWLWAKGHLHTDHVQRFRVTCARIETARPCYFHGDGEILGRTPVEISVVPQRCCVLRVADKNQA